VAIKYVAEIEQVHEVSLRGEAHVEPWEAELASLDLRGAVSDGRVPMMLSATSAKFRGMRFREFSISVLAIENGTNAEGWYLTHAFNSSRFFAWVERTMFATPYYFGSIDVTATAPARIQVASGTGGVSASMAPNRASREPRRRGPESWQGPLFLPMRGQGSPSKRKWFYARLSGDADVYAFDPSLDEVTITRAPEWPILAQLDAAGFRGTEWLLRTTGTHAKSQTYKRPTSQLS
jgi:hypothetical protein